MGKNLFAFLWFLSFVSPYASADYATSAALTECLESIGNANVPKFHTNLLGKSKSTFFAVTRQPFAVSQDRVPKATYLAGDKTLTYFLHAPNGHTFALPMPPKINSAADQDQCYEFDSPFKSGEKVFLRYFAKGMVEFGATCGPKVIASDGNAKAVQAILLTWKPFEIPEYSPQEEGTENSYGNPDFQEAEDRLITISAGYIDQLYRENAKGENNCTYQNTARLAAIDECVRIIDKANVLPEFYSQKIGLGYFAAGKESIYDHKKHAAYTIPSKKSSFVTQGCGSHAFKKKNKAKPASKTSSKAGSNLDDEDVNGNATY